MGGDRFSSGDASARGGRSRGRRHRRRNRHPVGGTHRSGYDAGKKIKGGKRHIVTDTGGLPVAVMVHEADIRDRAGAPGLLASTAISYPWSSHIFAEGGYGGGKLRGALDKTDKWTIEIIERSDTAKGVESLPRRRVVESAAFEGRSNGFQRPFENVLNTPPRNKLAFCTVPEPGDRDSRTA